MHMLTTVEVIIVIWYFHYRSLQETLVISNGSLKIRDFFSIRKISHFGLKYSDYQLCQRSVFQLENLLRG